MNKDQLVGVDPSLTSTGMATNEGTFTISTKLKGMERIDFIVNEFSNALNCIVDPVVAIEGYAMAKQSSHAHAQGELGGALRLHMHRSGIPYVEIPPTNRAKFATGKGNAGKSEVVSTVSALTGIVWTGSGADDECDAWVLREMLLHKFGMSEFKWSSKSSDALDRIDWSPLTKLGVSDKLQS